MDLLLIALLLSGVYVVAFQVWRARDYIKPYALEAWEKMKGWDW